MSEAIVEPNRIPQTWGEENGCPVPWDYGEPEKELIQIYDGSALVDFPDHKVLILSGTDARTFVHNQCTSNISKMLSMSALETIFLNSKGQVEFSGIVIAQEDEIWIISPSAEGLYARFKKYIVIDQVDVKISLEHHVLRIHGPGSSDLSEVLGDFPQKFGVSRGRDVLMARDDRGVWLVVLNTELETVWENLIMAGAQPVGRAAWRTWRVEHGFADLEDAKGELPQEVGWDGRVSYKKGCYLGQEIMARLEARGTTRYHMMGLLGQMELIPGTAIYRGEKIVGKVASSVDSPSLGSVALAVLRKELNPGDQVDIDGRSATVSSLPFQL